MTMASKSPSIPAPKSGLGILSSHDYLEDAFRKRFLINKMVWFEVASNRIFSTGDSAASFIKPVSSRLLLIMCQHPGVVLRRRHLIDALWTSQGMVVSDNSLNQAVCNLRDSFYKVDPQRLYIKTLPRIGYVFLANVEAHRVSHLDPLEQPHP
ncbi:winged helix-turn-helix domain-containing protein [Cupriavidus necator]